MSKITVNPNHGFATTEPHHRYFPWNKITVNLKDNGFTTTEPITDISLEIKLLRISKTMVSLQRNATTDISLESFLDYEK